MRPREDRDRIDQIRQKYYHEFDQRYLQIHTWKRETWDTRSDEIKAECDARLNDRSPAERISAVMMFVVLMVLCASLAALALALLVNLSGLIVSLFTHVYHFYLLSTCKYAAVALFLSIFIGFFLIRLYSGWDTQRRIYRWTAGKNGTHG